MICNSKYCPKCNEVLRNMDSVLVCDNCRSVYHKHNTISQVTMKHDATESQISIAKKMYPNANIAILDINKEG